MTEKKHEPIAKKEDSSNFIDDIFYVFSKPEKVINGVKELVSNTILKIPPKKQIKPHPIISNKILQGLLASQDEPTIRELFLNLLAASMDVDKIELAHPAFAEIINQICPDEAKVIRKLFLARKHEYPMVSINKIWSVQPNGKYSFETILKRYSLVCVNNEIQFPKLYPRYRDNLNRLGVMRIDDENYYEDNIKYEQILADSLVKDSIIKIREEGCDFQVKKGIIGLSDFGAAFALACIGENNG